MASRHGLFHLIRKNNRFYSTINTSFARGNAVCQRHSGHKQPEIEEFGLAKMALGTSPLQF
jgi:hypothetical protein